MTSPDSASALMPGSDELDGAEVSFAELVAQFALTLIDDGRSADRLPLMRLIVEGAVNLVGDADFASVTTLTSKGQLEAQVIEGDGVPRALMDAQNGIGEGPCLDAIKNNKQIRIPDLTTDIRWPEFAAHALALGVRSMLCTPMEVNGRVLGSMTLMGTRTGFEDDECEAMARIFAAHVAVALVGGRRLTDAMAALSNRDVIGQAKGILMERFRMTPDVAFATLVQVSSNTNTKLRTVCEQLCLTGVLAQGGPRVTAKPVDGVGPGQVPAERASIR